MINVMLVEDSKITRDMVENYIAKASEYKLTAVLENAANAEIVCMNGTIDLILMDVCTADDESGLCAAAKIKKYYPRVWIIIMTSMPEYFFILKAKTAGCDSFWYKEYGDTDLLDIINRTIKGESVYPFETPLIPIGIAVSNELTERKLIVLRQLALGSKYEEIAENFLFH